MGKSSRPFRRVAFRSTVGANIQARGFPLNIQQDNLLRISVEQSKFIMEKVLETGWYGFTGLSSDLVNIAPYIYPIHPSVLPVLANFFNRFWAKMSALFLVFFFPMSPLVYKNLLISMRLELIVITVFTTYLIMFRANFGHRLDIQSYRSHWSLIDSMVESFNVTIETELQVINQ